MRRSLWQQSKAVVGLRFWCSRLLVTTVLKEVSLDVCTMLQVSFILLWLVGSFAHSTPSFSASPPDVQALHASIIKGRESHRPVSRLNQDSNSTRTYVVNHLTGALEASTGTEQEFTTTDSWCHSTNEANPKERYARSCRYRNLAVNSEGELQYFAGAGPKAIPEGGDDFMFFKRISSKYKADECAMVMPMPVHFLRGCKSVPAWCAGSIFHGLADLVLPVFVMRQMIALFGEDGVHPEGSNLPVDTVLPPYDDNVLIVVENIDVKAGIMTGPLVSSLSRYPLVQKSTLDAYAKVLGGRLCLPEADFGDQFSQSRKMEYYYANELRPSDVRLRLIRQYSDHVVANCASANSEHAVAMRSSNAMEKVTVGLINRTPKPGANGRTITNFNEIKDAMKRYFNVQEFEFSAKSFAEDVRRLQKVDILIGQHGQGLTNLIFLPRTAAVIELQPEHATLFGVQMGLFPYQTMSTTMGLIYQRVEVEEEGVQPNMEKSDAQNLKEALRSLDTRRCTKASMLTQGDADKEGSACTLVGLFKSVKKRSSKFGQCGDMFGYFRDSSLEVNIKTLETQIGDVLHALEAREVYRQDANVRASRPLTFRMDTEDEKKAFGTGRGTSC